MEYGYPLTRFQHRSDKVIQGHALVKPVNHDRIGFRAAYEGPEKGGGQSIGRKDLVSWHLLQPRYPTQGVRLFS